MKTTSPSLKLWQRTVVSTLTILILWGVSIRSAQAGYIITLEQVGPNVVATGTGAIDMTDLSLGPPLPGALLPSMTPKFATIIMGQSSSGDLYFGTISGPANFGSGSTTLASSESGPLVATAFNVDQLVVPLGYSSGTGLSNSSTYNNATFSSLGVTPGTYEWTWGTGVNQNFTIETVTAGVPDSGSTFGLLLVAVTGLFGVSRLKSRQSA